MNFILKVISFYVGKSVYKRYPYGVTWYKNIYHKFLALIRKSFVIGCVIAVIAIVSGVSAVVYREVSPKIVSAEKIITVEKVLAFNDIPILVKICNAESGGRQFKKNGDVIRGIKNPSDIGFCQINEYINNDEARRLGYDIYTEKGNKDFAVHLFLTRGTQPWLASKKSDSNPNGWSI